MQRFTISLDVKLAQAFDGWIDERRYANRSEAVRDLFRAAPASGTLSRPVRFFSRQARTP